MKSLTSSSLRRNPEAIKKALIQKDGSLIANRDLTIHIPKRYGDIKLGIFKTDIYTLNCYAIVLDDKEYASSILLSFITLTPYNLSEITVDDVEYLELEFRKGDIIAPKLVTTVQDDILYPVINEFLINGNVPWFIDYEDLGARLIRTAGTHADSPVSRYLTGIEMLVSIMGRDSNDRTVLYRHSNKKHLTWIGLLNVFYAFKDTTNKVFGSYMKNGLVGSLVKQSDSVERIEDLIRR